MNKRMFVPKAERIVPRETTIEDLMDLLELRIEFSEYLIKKDL